MLQLTSQTLSSLYSRSLYLYKSGQTNILIHKITALVRITRDIQIQFAEKNQVFCKTTKMRGPLGKSFQEAVNICKREARLSGIYTFFQIFMPGAKKQHCPCLKLFGQAGLQLSSLCKQYSNILNRLIVVSVQVKYLFKLDEWKRQSKENILTTYYRRY